jgi:hypothetical protein
VIGGEVRFPQDQAGRGDGAGHGGHDYGHGGKACRDRGQPEGRTAGLHPAQGQAGPGGGHGRSDEPEQGDGEEPPRADPVATADQPDHDPEQGEIRNRRDRREQQIGQVAAAALAIGTAQHQQPQWQAADGGGQRGDGEGGVEDGVGPADDRVARGAVALGLGQLREDQPEARQHGRGD